MSGHQREDGRCESLSTASEGSRVCFGKKGCKLIRPRRFSTVRGFRDIMHLRYNSGGTAFFRPEAVKVGFGAFDLKFYEKG